MTISVVGGRMETVYGRITIDRDAVVRDIRILPKKKRKRSNFFMGNNNAAEDLALDTRLSKIDYKILLYLIGNMDYNNNVYTTISALAERFGMQRSYISLSIKNLSELSFVEVGKINGASTIHVSEYIASKGNLDD